MPRDAAREGPDIGLAEMIGSLRRELQTALSAGDGQAIQFDIDKIDLELQITVSRSAGAEAGIRFWVVDAAGKAEAGREVAHTFKLSLLPVLAETGTRVRVASDSSVAPARN